jgi:hypothetical protein
MHRAPDAVPPSGLPIRRRRRQTGDARDLRGSSPVRPRDCEDYLKRLRRIEGHVPDKPVPVFQLDRKPRSGLIARAEEPVFGLEFRPM